MLIKGILKLFVEVFVEPQLLFIKSFYPPYTIRYRSKKRSV